MFISLFYLLEHAMNVFTAVFLCGLLFGAGFASDAELSGIYVNKKSPQFHRLEFLADGRYFNSYTRGDHGTYTVDKDLCICRNEDGEELKFQRKGRILLDGEGNQWLPREDIHKLPWKEVFPATIVVLDEKTHKPVPRYAYTYSIQTPTAEYDPLLVRPTEVQSEKGEFILMAPESCKIDVRIAGEGVVGGFHEGGGAYSLTSENKQRRIEVLVKIGLTIEGMVVDSKTGKPVKDALVSPLIFTPPLFTADRNRGVKTDGEGKFMVRGVDNELGINVWHQDYLGSGDGDFEKNGKKIGEKLYRTRIELERGERLIGTVKDSTDKPLAGVNVSDGAGKQVKTDNQGAFVLASPKKWGGEDTYNLSFEKDGYLRKELNPRSADPKGFSVILQAMPVLVGQVLAPEGKPIEAYNVAAGVGREPAEWRCSCAKVHSAEGRFSLQVSTDRDYDNERKVWIGIAAPGFAFWETTIDTWEGTHRLTAQLTKGVAVQGSVNDRINHPEKITANLLPCRIHEEESSSETSHRQEMGRFEAAIDSQGVFHFEHVAAGQYILAIAGPAISPISTSINVS